MIDGESEQDFCDNEDGCEDVMGIAGCNVIIQEVEEAETMRDEAKAFLATQEGPLRAEEEDFQQQRLPFSFADWFVRCDEGVLLFLQGCLIDQRLHADSAHIVEGYDLERDDQVRSSSLFLCVAPSCGILDMNLPHVPTTTPTLSPSWLLSHNMTHWGKEACLKGNGATQSAVSFKQPIVWPYQEVVSEPSSKTFLHCERFVKFAEIQLARRLRS